MAGIDNAIFFLPAILKARRRVVVTESGGNPCVRDVGCVCACLKMRGSLLISRGAYNIRLEFYFPFRWINKENFRPGIRLNVRIIIAEISAPI